MENGTSLMNYMIKITTAFLKRRKERRIKKNEPTQNLQSEIFSTRGGRAARNGPIGQDSQTRE